MSAETGVVLFFCTELAKILHKDTPYACMYTCHKPIVSCGSFVINVVFHVKEGQSIFFFFKFYID